MRRKQIVFAVLLLTMIAGTLLLAPSEENDASHSIIDDSLFIQPNESVIDSRQNIISERKYVQADVSESFLSLDIGHTMKSDKNVSILPVTLNDQNYEKGSSTLKIPYNNYSNEDGYIGYGFRTDSAIILSINDLIDAKLLKVVNGDNKNNKDVMYVRL